MDRRLQPRDGKEGRQCAEGKSCSAHNKPKRDGFDREESSVRSPNRFDWNGPFEYTANRSKPEEGLDQDKTEYVKCS